MTWNKTLNRVYLSVLTNIHSCFCVKLCVAFNTASYFIFIKPIRKDCCIKGEILLTVVELMTILKLQSNNKHMIYSLYKTIGLLVETHILSQSFSNKETFLTPFNRGFSKKLAVLQSLTQNVLKKDAMFYLLCKFTLRFSISINSYFKCLPLRNLSKRENNHFFF